MLRVGVVSYLNALPLVEGAAETDDVELVKAPPADIARVLLDGTVDVALTPSVALIRDERLTYLPGACVGADGDVASVRLFLRDGVDQPRRIALDRQSRTSQMLTRIYVGEVLGVPSETVAWSEAPPHHALAAGDDWDGVLAIGDLALQLGDVAGWRSVDLGRAWRDHTGLPFVFAVWGLRRDLLETRPELADMFLRWRDLGLRRLDIIARREGPAGGVSVDRARSYLEQNIRYHLEERDERGLRAFLERARALEATVEKG